ncbi:MAG: ATP-binding protein [Anaerolineae bacterium]|nr:ATP-binding protein [Anaerolineae bacterium]
METDGRFYLGRLVNEEEETRPYLYAPDDLTTHAFVVGMTGSGKTGLCLNLLEEAALQGIPALMIDPKGDITNALLHFPDLVAANFQPWLNVAEAQRAGQTVAELAEATAVSWRNGLAAWGMEPARIQQLADSAHFAIYTPGSEAGLKVSILASLAAPDLPWEANRELLREQIAGTVTAVLGLIGLKDIDPVRSREHILLANIFEHHWQQESGHGPGQGLDLPTLIREVQTPPFAQLGVFEVNTFSRKRNALNWRCC